MSAAWFAGFITGNLIVFALAVVAFLVRRKRGHIDYDERVALISARSGAAAFNVTALVAYGAWIVDNMLAFKYHEAARIVSPWSGMLLVMLIVWLISYAYTQWQLTGKVPMSPAKRKQMAASLLLIATSLTPFVFDTLPPAVAALRWLLVAMQVILVGMGVAYLFGHRAEQG